MAPLNHCNVGEVEDAVLSTVSGHPSMCNYTVMAFILAESLLVIAAYIFVFREKRGLRGLTENVSIRSHRTPAVGRTPVQETAVPARFCAHAFAMGRSPPSVLEADTHGPIALITYLRLSLAYIPGRSVNPLH
ncbi:hypothetical protein CERSUDRAFT_111918 [Gelatoporia subvermispora B]|uniref:Uncharacterized protein n=1 Tax=Ceriporiopsis subvermispora (strain B) TaxID=914234 RepID=M2RLA0_CERS8|nr:hypothetical protein CERSUDRAFT_111918 [Gelatoporia subvermispora B]